MVGLSIVEPCSFGLKIMILGCPNHGEPMFEDLRVKSTVSHTIFCGEWARLVHSDSVPLVRHWAKPAPNPRVALLALSCW